MNYCDFLICSPNAESKAIVWAALIAMIPAIGAIIAAFRVGLRQADIQRRQAEIAGEALKLEDLKVRADLFDKRMAVYEAVQNFRGMVLRNGEPLLRLREKTADDKARDEEINWQFFAAMDRSKFLFGQGVHDALKENLWRRSMKLDYHAASARNRDPEEGEGLDHDAAAQLIRQGIERYDVDGLLGAKLRLY